MKDQKTPDYIYENKSAAHTMSEQRIQDAFGFCEGYKAFMNQAKTEREATKFILNQAVTKGYKPFSFSGSYQTGDRLYFNNRGKAVILAIVGQESLEQGVRIVASHIDAPRLDLKPRPLYEDGKMAFFKTHYYGGIKKYQWPTVALALHGTVIKADGTSVDVCIGEEESDPVFYINDLLPHLDRNGQKKISEYIPAENLNVLVGSLPLDENTKDPIKTKVLALLQEKYDIVEEDLFSSELCVVPAAKPRDVGLDRSLIAAYAHDDRVCAYTSLQAMLEINNTPKYTTVCVFADKEETGSESNTGLNTHFLYDFICDLAQTQGANPRKTWYNTKCLSADVNACFDPNFSDVYERLNAAYINHGVVITKYTGGGGKNSTNDATAEFFGQVRSILNANNVCWQSAELGKVDAGGGGTVAKYLARLNADVIDIGVPVISMHAPLEVVSKLDVYNTYLAFSAFFAD